MSTVTALLLMGGIAAYCVFGGADFGAGFWDLTAGASARGRRPREVIDHAIGPVWEANHVWLIFCFVILWTGFPEAYESITLTMFVPLTLAALGVVLRGASFAFRESVVSLSERRALGATFAVSSVLVPFFFGAIAGGIASGRVPDGGRSGDPVDSWLNPTSIVGGVLAVAVVAYLAATYLVVDSHRLADVEMVAYFRRRAIGAGVAAGAVVVVGLFVLRSDAPDLFTGLRTHALPLIIVSALSGVGSLVALTRGWEHGSRVLAVGAVVSIVLAWGVAQWPYILPETLEVADAAAPPATLTALLVVAVLAVVIVVPGFVLLYTLDQRGLLPAEGVDESEGAAPVEEA